MQITKIISTVLFITFLVGCNSTKQVSSDTATAIKKDKIFTKQDNFNQENSIEIKKEELPLYELTQKEKDFLEILKNDEYASLCASQDRYLSLKDMPASSEKSELLKELFYDYANNLNNSCIDQEGFKRTLKKSKYKKNKQSYEMYNHKIDKEKLFESYGSSDISIKSILEQYTPKHPVFYKLVSKSEINKP